MYRLIVESLLGLQLEVNKLRLTPCLPADWKSFKLHERYRETFFHITVQQLQPSSTVPEISLEGERLPGLEVPLTEYPFTPQSAELGFSNRAVGLSRLDRHTQSSVSRRSDPATFAG